MSESRARVVIVGGGFGGLFAAKALAGASVSVTLVDKRNYHLFRPMLYQVATGLLSAALVTICASPAYLLMCPKSGCARFVRQR